MKKIICFLLSCLLISNILIPTSFAATSNLTDISTSYAKDAIINLNENNIVTGYTDKTFKPKSYITRGESAVLLNNLIRYKYVAENKFLDLDNAFYTDSILKLNYAEIMLGFPENKVKPKDYITTEEAITLLCRVFQITTNQKVESYSQFKNWDKIGSWAKPYFSALIENRYLDLSLLQFNNMNPKGYITREDFVYILNSIVSVFIKDKDVNAISNKVYNENVIICKENIIFTNCDFNNILYVSPSVNCDTIEFKNCKINKIVKLKEGIKTYENEEDEMYQNILAKYTIPFDKTNEDLFFNLNKCAEKINNTILSTGEIFSFNEVVDDVSELNGYKVVSEFYSNNKEDLVGGGICQISSLLYSLALQSGFEIVSRTSHESLPDYISPGTDADVFYKNNNLEVKNTYHVPVQIKIDVNNSGIITAYFCTQSLIKAKTVNVFTYKGQDNVWYTEQYIDGILKDTITSTYNS